MQILCALRTFSRPAGMIATFAAAAAVWLSTPDSSSADQLSVSQYARVTATLPWAVASKKGFFEEAGLEIEDIIAGAGGGTTLRNMLASDLPYGEVAMSAALAAIRQGVDIIVVNVASDHIGEMVLATMPDSPLTSVNDLDGKKAGYTNPKSTSEILLQIALKNAGMLGKVELIPTGGFGPGLTALGAGGIDAAPLTDPILSLEPEKYKPIFAFGELVPRISWLVGVATREFAESNPEKLRKLIAVRRKAVDYIYDNPDEAAAIYAEVWERDKADVDKFFPKYFEMADLWSRGNFVDEGLTAMSDGQQLVGEISEPVDWSAVVDRSYLPEDLQ